MYEHSRSCWCCFGHLLAFSTHPSWQNSLSSSLFLQVFSALLKSLLRLLFLPPHPILFFLVPGAGLRNVFPPPPVSFFAFSSGHLFSQVHKQLNTRTIITIRDVLFPHLCTLFFALYLRICKPAGQLCLCFFLVSISHAFAACKDACTLGPRAKSS